MKNPFDEILGKDSRPKPSPIDPTIAFGVWCGKHPFFAKLPADDEAVIKLKAGDSRRIVRAAYTAGIERAK